MTEERLRLSALTVLSGSLRGRKHEPADVVGEVLIGSDPDCHFVLDLPSISPIHARVWTEIGHATVHDTHAPQGVYVNDERVQGEATLEDGDVLWLGAPDDPASLCIQCRFAPWEEILPPAEEAADGGPSGEVETDSAFVVADPVDAATVEEEGGPPSSPASHAAVPAPEADDPFFVSPEPVPAPRKSGAAADAAGVASPAPAAPTVEPAIELPAFTADESEFVVAVPSASVPAVASPPAVAPAPLSASEDDPFFVSPEPPAAARPQPAPGAAKPVVPAAPTQQATTGAGAGQPATTHVAVPKAAPPAPAARAGTSPQAAPVATATPPRPGETRPAQQASATPQPRAERAQPSAPRPAARPVAARPAAARPAPARRSSSARPTAHGSGKGTLWIGLAAAALLVAGGSGAWYAMGAVRVDRIEPARVRVGQRAVVHGKGFGSDPSGVTVLFDDKSAKVVAATPTRLEVEVPEVVAEAGSERRVSVGVRRGRRASAAASAQVFQGPRVHALSLRAALPGDEVALAGAGLGPGATVRFGSASAQVVESDGVRLRVLVPDLAVGSLAPVTVTIGGVESNAVPFVVGRLPLVTEISPKSARPGEVVQISGLGFDSDPLNDHVLVAGAAALVLSASDATLKVVVPRVGSGDPLRPVEVRVPSQADPGAGTLEVAGPGDEVEARFVAEPFTAVPGRPHAVVSTGLGPAFVLAAADGRSAASRAFDVQERLNAAVGAMQTTVGVRLEARGLDAQPTIGMSGSGEAVIEVRAEDVAAYGEDWSGLRGRGGAVSAPRLARWWEAVGRDLLGLLARGERPHFAADLAPEGRVLQQVFDTARKAGKAGIPRALVEQARPPLREALRLVALRVPPSVKAPVVASATGTAAAAAPTPLPPLEGSFQGQETESGEVRYISVTFEKAAGAIEYEGGLSLTMPFLSFERRGRDGVHWSVRIRGGVRHYIGRWDGEKVAGSISREPDGTDVVATFELRRR